MNDKLKFGILVALIFLSSSIFAANSLIQMLEDNESANTESAAQKPLIVRPEEDASVAENKVFINEFSFAIPSVEESNLLYLSISKRISNLENSCVSGINLESFSTSQEAVQDAVYEFYETDDVTDLLSQFQAEVLGKTALTFTGQSVSSTYIIYLVHQNSLLAMEVSTNTTDFSKEGQPKCTGETIQAETQEILDQIVFV